MPAELEQTSCHCGAVCCYAGPKNIIILQCLCESSKSWEVESLQLEVQRLRALQEAIQACFFSCTFRTLHPHCGARLRIQTPFLANLHNVAKLTLDTEGRRAGQAGQQGPRSQAQGGLHVSCCVLGYEVEVSSLRKHALFQSWLLDLGMS